MNREEFKRFDSSINNSESSTGRATTLVIVEDETKQRREQSHKIGTSFSDGPHLCGDKVESRYEILIAASSAYYFVRFEPLVGVGAAEIAMVDISTRGFDQDEDDEYRYDYDKCCDISFHDRCVSVPRTKTRTS